MAQRRISYADRDFESLRQDLINYTQQYYPELIDNFNDASVYSVFLDLSEMGLLEFCFTTALFLGFIPKDKASTS